MRAETLLPAFFRRAPAPADAGGGLSRRLWRRIVALSKRMLHAGGKGSRRLRLSESLSLGERRFVAVVEFEGSRFLLGGTATSVVLLSRLRDPQPMARAEWDGVANASSLTSGQSSEAQKSC